MFHCENDLLANLIVLTPKIARKRFRESIFEDWNWCCAYCDKQLSDRDATIDHIVPKHKGGHSTRSNLACSCQSCNQKKGSSAWKNWYEQTPYYSKEKENRICEWLTNSFLDIEWPQTKNQHCH
jgi:hypothetical protein